MNSNHNPAPRASARALVRAVALLALTVVAAAGDLPGNARPAESSNLLQNGSMETFHSATNPATGEENSVADGWTIFVESGAPRFISSAEFSGAPCGAAGAGILTLRPQTECFEGNDLQMIYTPNGPEPFVAGLYQTVHGLTPGVSYAFSGRTAAVSAYELIGRKLGWDPYGGTDPRSPNVIWGAEQWDNHFSAWKPIWMAELARTDTATVFIRIDHPHVPTAGVSQTYLDAYVLDQAPIAHTNPLAARQSSATFSVSWALDWRPSDTEFDYPSSWYEVEARDGSGAWSYWIAKTDATQGSFPGEDCHTYGFRSRAIVMHPVLSNVGSRLPSYWPPQGQVTTTVLTTPPSSAVNALSTFQPERFTVSWLGSGGSCGATGYDVQVRDGPSGVWTNWLQGTTWTSALFTGQNGHTYSFRSRAAGLGGYLEPYPSGADASTTVDALGPAVTLGPLPMVEMTTSLALSWTAADAGSGVTSYDVQTRSVRLADGLDSGWQSWISATTDTQAQVTATDGTRVDFRVTARDAVGNAASATAGTNVLLSPAAVLVTSDASASTTLPRPGERVTITVSLSNTGNLSATAGLVMSMPVGMGRVITESIAASQGAPAWDGAVVNWTGPLEAGEGAVVAAAMVVSETTPLGMRASARATISDGVHLPFARVVDLLVPYRTYLPVNLRQ